ncbi:peptidylprolyl isomerase [Microvirga sp. CF3062]|uniref:peptidylprolyl isomerase n=1 Tax=Microvirga sp. CF3062 TaxID=3110182 RepID=UPI002E78334C|nr:peptidylprolyl isomerase [Microvirga sp. CF3062]MEE1658276.1 peptidylprolyl isomerase [Microvirga sp. CF3062]
MRLLKEPLLHFVAIGGLLFAVHASLDPSGGGGVAAPPAIHLTAADAEWLKQMWTRQWRRPPTDEELKSLVADHLKEEVLSREARALELDIGDIVVRRRLAQKMTFLLDDTIRTAEPPEAELRALYETRPDLVRTPARVSFLQVFFRREQGGDRARTSLAALSNAAALPVDHGDRLLLGDTFADQDEQALANLFGAAFARAVMTLQVGNWSDPIESTYGVHLVKVTEAPPSRAIPFSEVRERLAEEWRRERQETANAQLYEGLLRKYRLVADPAVRPLLGPLENHAEVRP